MKKLVMIILIIAMTTAISGIVNASPTMFFTDFGSVNTHSTNLESMIGTVGIGSEWERGDQSLIEAETLYHLVKLELAKDLMSDTNPRDAWLISDPTEKHEAIIKAFSSNREMRRFGYATPLLVEEFVLKTILSPGISYWIDASASGADPWLPWNDSRAVYDTQANRVDMGPWTEGEGYLLEASHITESRILVVGSALLGGGCIGLALLGSLVLARRQRISYHRKSHRGSWSGPVRAYRRRSY